MSILRSAVVSLALVTGPVTASSAADRWLDLPAPPPMPDPVSSGTAAINGIEIYYATYGAGDDVILLIHGGLGHADIWANQIGPLAEDHRVVVADSRGHGRSTRSEEPFGYALMASDYLALLDFLGIDKVSLVGWSDGGIIGLDIAIEHPERLNALFAHAANATVDGVDPAVATDPTFNAYIERMGEDYRRMSKTPDQYDAFVEQISAMWASQPAYTEAQLAGIGVPTAIVLGDHDEAITRVHTDYLAATIPNAKLVILPDVSHFAMLQDPDGYTQAVFDFLDDR